MKKLMYILILCTGIFLLNASVVQAQKRYIPEQVLTTRSNTLNHKLVGKQYYAMIVPDGSVFLFDEWKTGYVILDNGDRYDDLSLKYNIYYDELIHINDRSLNMIMLDKNTISEFGFYDVGGGESMVFTKTTFPQEQDEKYYFRQMYNGKLKLVVRHKSLEEQTLPYKDKYGLMRNTTYNTYTDYYLVFPENRFEKFNLKRRSFVDLFAGDKERKKEVKRLLRQNHIYFENNLETIRAVSLVEEAFYSTR